MKQKLTQPELERREKCKAIMERMFSRSDEWGFRRDERRVNVRMRMREMEGGGGRGRSERVSAACRAIRGAQVGGREVEQDSGELHAGGTLRGRGTCRVQSRFRPLRRQIERHSRHVLSHGRPLLWKQPVVYANEAVFQDWNSLWIVLATKWLEPVSSTGWGQQFHPGRLQTLHSPSIADLHNFTGHLEHFIELIIRHYCTHLQVNIVNTSRDQITRYGGSPAVQK